MLRPTPRFVAFSIRTIGFDIVSAFVNFVIQFEMNMKEYNFFITSMITPVKALAKRVGKCIHNAATFAYNSASRDLIQTHHFSSTYSRETYR